MTNIFDHPSGIVTGCNGFIGSSFVHYVAELHNDNCIAGPESSLRINAMVHSAHLRPFAGAARSMRGPRAACSIAVALNSARNACLDTNNPMYLNSLF